MQETESPLRGGVIPVDRLREAMTKDHGGVRRSLANGGKSLFPGHIHGVRVYQHGGHRAPGSGFRHGIQVDGNLRRPIELPDYGSKSRVTCDFAAEKDHGLKWHATFEAIAAPNPPSAANGLVEDLNGVQHLRLLPAALQGRLHL